MHDRSLCRIVVNDDCTLLVTGLNEWREDIKRVLRAAGGQGRDVVFLILDSQLQNDAFLQDIDSLLNSGLVPNIFSVEEKQEIIEASHQPPSSISFQFLFQILPFIIASDSQFLFLFEHLILSIPAGTQCLPPNNPGGLQSCHADVLLCTAVQGSLASGPGLQSLGIEFTRQRPLLPFPHQLLHHRLV